MELEKEVTELEKVKKKRLVAMKTDQAVNAIMQNRANDIQQLKFDNLTVVELETLLRRHNQLMGKMTKQEKVLKVMEIFQSNPVPAPLEEWTADDEGKLQRMKCADIDLEDTAVGRKKALMTLQFRAAGVDMPDDEFNQIIELRKRKRDEANTE